MCDFIWLCLVEGETSFKAFKDAKSDVDNYMKILDNTMNEEDMEVDWQEIFPNTVKWQAHDEAIDIFLQVRCIDKLIHADGASHSRSNAPSVQCHKYTK